MTEPTTKEELIEWFADRPNAKNVKTLVENGSEPNEIHWLWEDILHWGLGSTPTENMWIAPTGRIWSVAFATHSSLARAMGLTEGRLEEAGWIKVSSGWAYGEIRPTAKQARILNDGGYRISNRLTEASMKAKTRRPLEIWE